MDVIERARATIEERGLATPQTPVLLMVSGGSDSTALAYIAHDLRERGVLGPLALVHVNHKLRGEDADKDAEFAARLAHALDIQLFSCEVDVAALVEQERGNLEAIARRERYAAAHKALVSLCQSADCPVSAGRIFTAHTADDRVENFYMRSIVGTGPGGFRSMLYLNGQVARPLLEVGREDLREFILCRADAGAAVADEAGAWWREDATNEHTDRFRAYVRAEIVPRAKKRNPQLLDTLTRTMNLIADEDDMLDQMSARIEDRCVKWLDAEETSVDDFGGGCVITPSFAREPQPLKRRVLMSVLGRMLGPDARVETASIEAVLAAYKPLADGVHDGEDAAGDPAALIESGYVCNIQGNLAISANKKGVRIEPMASFRARRKR